MFKYKHVALGHCGPTLLLSAVSTRLRVIGARRLARSTCKTCVTCRKIAARPEPQLMGQLPEHRITPSPPFSITGVDYAGPFTLKKGHTRRPVLIKAYLAIFVCCSTKAAHIEVMSDLQCCQATGFFRFATDFGHKIPHPNIVCLLTEIPHLIVRRVFFLIISSLMLTLSTTVISLYCYVASISTIMGKAVIGMHINAALSLYTHTHTTTTTFTSTKCFSPTIDLWYRYSFVVVLHPYTPLTF